MEKLTKGVKEMVGKLYRRNGEAASVRTETKVQTPSQANPAAEPAQGEMRPRKPEPLVRPPVVRPKPDASIKNDLEAFKRTAHLVFKKLERQIEILEAIETSVEEKLVTFERLLQMAEGVNTPAVNGNRRHEIVSLKSRGLKTEEIANVLGMRTGEVELILNLSA